ncbi:MAG TPA: hypothetical protein VHC40_10920 [Rhizomicrobium sp.]|nr:hypothetical protein [Rhizomicrobium sp.]
MVSAFIAAAAAAPIMAGAVTHGGAVSGSAVVHVTSLEDSGPGTLRDAVRMAGPKVIVFDVGGVIHLASDLKVSIPSTTIAGQTAPALVTLTGGSLRLSASDLVVQHIAVRPGPADSAEVNGNRDSMTIGGGKRLLRNIRVENVSLTWSVDEDADVAGNTQNVTVRNSIIGEALRNAGHPKGRHSMGMLINKDNQGVAVTGNLFVGNMFRNPVIARGSSAFVGYNLIADPAENGIHFYDAPAPTTLMASIVGNIVVAGKDTKKNVTAVQIPDDMSKTLPDAQIYLSANQAPPGAVTNRGNFTLAATPPVNPPGGFAPPADVRASVLRYAGARPSARDSVDAHILSGIADGTVRVIDNPADVGGLPQTAPVQAVAEVPQTPFGESGQPGMLRIEAWLCERHLELGGPQTPECPGDAATYRTLLHARMSQRR